MYFMFNYQNSKIFKKFKKFNQLLHCRYNIIKRFEVWIKLTSFLWAFILESKIPPWGVSYKSFWNFVDNYAFVARKGLDL
jgi:hypothetical protein